MAGWRGTGPRRLLPGRPGGHPQGLGDWPDRPAPAAARRDRGGRGSGSAGRSASGVPRAAGVNGDRAGRSWVPAAGTSQLQRSARSGVHTRGWSSPAPARRTGRCVLGIEAADTGPPADLQVRRAGARAVDPAAAAGLLRVQVAPGRHPAPGRTAHRRPPVPAPAPPPLPRPGRRQAPPGRTRRRRRTAAPPR